MCFNIHDNNETTNTQVLHNNIHIILNTLTNTLFVLVILTNTLFVSEKWSVEPSILSDIDALLNVKPTKVHHFEM